MATKATTKKGAEAKAPAKKGAGAKASANKSAQPKKAASAQPIDKKLWPFYILEVLRTHALDGAEHDDAGNSFLTRQQIVDYLKEEYGIETQIKAVGDNLTRLYEAGADYPELGFSLEFLEGERNAQGGSAKGKRQLLRKGWRWAEESAFEPGEVRMLIDSVIASPAIPEKQTRMLIDKLTPLSMEKIAVPNTMRVGHQGAHNPQFFWNVDVLNEAIHTHRNVSFDLGTFGKDGKLRVKESDATNGKHHVNPAQLLISKGHHYLLGRYADSDEMYKFRVDLMLNVDFADDSVEDIDDTHINIVKFREQHSYMMSGKVMKVTLRIDKERLHTLYDQFGPDVHFKNERADTVDVELKSALYSVLFWALQYYRSVEVLSPPELRQVLAEAGETIHEMYAGKPGAIPLAARQSNDELINGK